MKNKKNIITLTVIAFIIIGGVTFGVIRNNQVQAQKIVQQKHDDLVKKEKTNLENAKIAVDKAYKTRIDKDITSANTAISKLDKNQESDKTALKNKMTVLAEFLNQISDVNTALAKATKSKANSDINATQDLINKETNDYLKTDKASAQAKLDALKKQIADEKAKADAQAQQEQANDSNITNSDVPVDNSGSTQNYGASSPNYNAPSNSGTPSTPQAPANNGNTSTNQSLPGLNHNTQDPSNNPSHAVDISGDGSNPFGFQ